ncbi:MAG TPA: hypothetical protein DCG19_04660 [Cryomorphaceae bacterium]|nr:hypothetical protein [Owenweeksia sp.]MBF98842.1 hypothetical protein [Owenweeksia sp.]HAD96674.1 hypothetical protein [Cryomorphaceae bacterium]|tara:strand:- start:201 stop:965 length:765 start_codon:yes stop_codon:yes gene_type:complete
MKEEDGKNTTEDVLKQKLEGFKLPVEESVFEAIQSEINLASLPAKRKNRIAGWLLLALLCTLGITLVWVFYPLKNQSAPQLQPVDSVMESPDLPADTKAGNKDSEGSGKVSGVESLPETITEKSISTGAVSSLKTQALPVSDTKTSSGSEKVSSVSLASAVSEPDTKVTIQYERERVQAEKQKGEIPDNSSFIPPGIQGAGTNPDVKETSTAFQPVDPEERGVDIGRTTSSEAALPNDTSLVVNEKGSLLSLEQ